ncbi:hypothetical protein [Parafilimonas terrae]|uniref:Uncharacterized protein n=1 Tax=Parafilimonas terrae TaxID=1465490 RepID=A0A1I5SEN4_9BACT|nr:hypothetical protein [Parafilimonas terrae]SFP69152.1 hypothetical protein SAMN05444277_101727 [Parafilimonas terrae]
MKYLSLIIALLFFEACNQQPGAENNTADSAAIQNDVKPSERDSLSGINNSGETNNDTITNEEPANKVIVPGKSIGNIEIGMDDSGLEVFGKPDMSDAAMGKAWLTWYGKKPDEHNNKTQLNVYTAYKDTSMRAKTVQQIRTTSSFFETADGLHVYASLKDIKQQYPKLKKVAAYTDDGRKIDIYDAQQQGIAFEVVNANQQQICTGIIIHKSGVKVTQVYISLHPDMHVL